MKASKVNRTMTVICGKQAVNILNVLVGEVWLCSGQSNMEMPMWTNRPTWRAADGDKFVKAAKHPLIRFTVTRPYSVSATPDSSFPVKWQVMSPDNTERFSATAFFFGTRLHKELDIPIGLITSHWGGTRIEPWTPPCGFDSVPELKKIADDVNAKIPGTETYKRFAKETQLAYAKWMNSFTAASQNNELLPPPPAFPEELKTGETDRRTPCAIYNKMIVPYLPYAIRGAIWYQGCSNLNDGMLYAQKMQALLNGWRSVFKNPDMRFYFVQLAPFTYGRNNTRLAQLWEAQQAFEDSNDQKVGMAVINDVGDFRDIHPRDKKTVGYRLADLALSRDYGKKEIKALYPRLEKYEIKDGKFILTFKNVTKWKTAKGFADIDTFQVADSDGDYKTAHVIAKGNQLIVWSNAVKHPQNLRYMWLHVCAGKLFNENGLPLGAFRIEKAASEADILKAIENAGNRLVEKYDAKNRKRLIDKRAESKTPFKQITYFIAATKKDGSFQWLAISMDAYTTNALRTGVPLKDTGASFQTYVNNVKVIGNVPGIAGRFIDKANIEFWPNNYDGRNTAKIPGASNNFDFGDQISSTMGYGCMQIHDYQTRTTLFAYNNFNSFKSDFGFGNNPKGSSDWTFAATIGNYKSVNIYTLLSGEDKAAALVAELEKSGAKLVEKYNVLAHKRELDKRASVKEPFSRITYLATAKTHDGDFKWLAVSMDAYTKDAKLTGVPLADTKICFQTYVNNIAIEGNIPQFAGKKIARGNIEFWPFTYSSNNAKNIPGADSKTYDFGDAVTKNGRFGSMQIHDYAAKTTIFAFNCFYSKTPDFGFGNNEKSRHKDWTFSAASRNYSDINIFTFVSNK